MTIYIALLRKDPDSDYGVDFPDFPGCVSAAATLEEVRASAGEALAFHIEGLIADDEPVPEPRSLTAILADPHNRDALPFILEVHLPGTRCAPHAAE